MSGWQKDISLFIIMTKVIELNRFDTWYFIDSNFTAVCTVHMLVL